MIWLNLSFATQKPSAIFFSNCLSVISVETHVYWHISFVSIKMRKCLAECCLLRSCFPKVHLCPLSFLTTTENLQLFHWSFVPDEDAKVKAQLEQSNKALTRELEEVKRTLSQTEQTLTSVTEQKTMYHEHIVKTSNSLMSTVKGLLGLMKKVESISHIQKCSSHPVAGLEM